MLGKKMAKWLVASMLAITSCMGSSGYGYASNNYDSLDAHLAEIADAGVDTATDATFSTRLRAALKEFYDGHEANADNIDTLSTNLARTIRDVDVVNAGVVQNRADIAQNRADIAQNRADIAQNRADIAQNRADIAQNKEDIAQNRVDITQNKKDIAQNRVDIRQNQKDIAQNRVDIRQNQKDIAQNRVDIRQNQKDIAQNRVDIRQNQKDIAQNRVDIRQNKENIAQNRAKIIQNKENIALNRTNIAQNKADIAQNRVNITQNRENIAQNRAAIKNETFERRMDVARLDSRIDRLDTKVNRGIAMVAAIANISPPSYDKDHKLSASLAVANYHGENAIAASLMYQPTHNINTAWSISTCGGETLATASITIRL